MSDVAPLNLAAAGDGGLEAAEQTRFDRETAARDERLQAATDFRTAQINAITKLSANQEAMEKRLHNMDERLREDNKKQQSSQYQQNNSSNSSNNLVPGNKHGNGYCQPRQPAKANHYRGNFNQGNNRRNNRGAYRNNSYNKFNRGNQSYQHRAPPPQFSFQLPQPQPYQIQQHIQQQSYHIQQTKSYQTHQTTHQPYHTQQSYQVQQQQRPVQTKHENQTSLISQSHNPQKSSVISVGTQITTLISVPSEIPKLLEGTHFLSNTSQKINSASQI